MSVGAIVSPAAAACLPCVFTILYDWDRYFWMVFLAKDACDAYALLFRLSRPRKDHFMYRSVALFSRLLSTSVFARLTLGALAVALSFSTTFAQHKHPDEPLEKEDMPPAMFYVTG